VSHSYLLLRSTKTDARPTQIDVMFKGVKRIDLPVLIDNLEVHDLDVEADGPHGFQLKGSGVEGLVIASVGAWLENDLEYYDPSPLLPDLEIDPALGDAPAFLTRSRQRLAAIRNNTDAPIHITTYIVVIPSIITGTSSRPKIAIAPTSACATAVATITRAMPSARKRTTIAPMIATSNTPTYIRFAGLRSSPISADGQVRPHQEERGADRGGGACAIGQAGVPAREQFVRAARGGEHAAEGDESRAVQFTSCVKRIATAGTASSAAALVQIARLQRLPALRRSSAMTGAPCDG
jgi:hypothetical protein